MTYDNENNKNRDDSGYSQPYKRKRVIINNKSGENSQSRSYGNNDTKKPLYSSDKVVRKVDRTDETQSRGNNSYGRESYNRDGDKPFVRKSGSSGNYTGGSGNYGSPGGGYKSSGSGGFKKPYGQGAKPGYQNKYSKPYGRPVGKPTFVKPTHEKIRQPDYHFDDDTNNGPIRLNKFIANTGLCSRREADEYIQAGLITVNGNLISELGSKVMPTDDIRYNGARMAAERKVYILLNKPKDYVTSVDDPHAKRTVMELVQGACRERIYPVGRLDRMTTGVLLLTNDGELTKKLTHPASEIRKVYQVQLEKAMKVEDMHLLLDGVTLDDGFIKADKISHVFEDDKSIVGIEIHSGRNRVIRRIFEKIGYHVLKLDRIYFGGLTKKGLSRGKWRYLAPREVGFLKMLKS